MDRCAECGFVYDDVAVGALPGVLRSFGPRWAELLRSTSPDDLRRRPSPEVWSGLEYACHVRDVFRVQHDRLRLALAEDSPEFQPMGREELVVSARYNEQDPAVVAAELEAEASALAGALAALDEAGWARTGIYDHPERRSRTMVWFGRHTVHEGEHHLMDVERGLRRPGR